MPPPDECRPALVAQAGGFRVVLGRQGGGQAGGDAGDGVTGGRLVQLRLCLGRRCIVFARDGRLQGGCRAVDNFREVVGVVKHLQR